MDEYDGNSDETMSFKERRARFEKMSKDDYNNTSDEMLEKDWEAMSEKSHATPKMSKDDYNNTSDEMLEKDWEAMSKKSHATRKSSKYGHLRVFQEPLCLVRNDDKVLSIVESVMEEISTIKDTVNIITIAGPCGTGKSYLMNRLAGVKQGFPLGNTTDATTKGLWVLCLEHPERKDEILMLIDTEGIGDVIKGDEENDNKILCLAILISGTFVYNSMGVINHDVLKKLSFVTKLSEKIIMSDEIPQFILDIGAVFPTFVLCLRDFTLNIPENETPDTYFEKSLALETDVKQMKTQEYNEIKKSILKHFPWRKCFVFGIPVSNRKILERLVEVHESDLSEDFRADTKKFLQYMFSTKPKKLFDGSSINGRMFASLTKEYTDSLANCEMPCIDDALTTMAKQENEFALEEAVGMCQRQIQSLGVPLSDDFEQKYQQMQRGALKHIRKKAVLDDLQEYQMKAELKLSCLEFEDRCRKQDEKKWTKASINGLQIEAEIQKHAEMLTVKNDKLLQKEDLKKNSEEEKWKTFKEELASEREKERKELEEKYAKLLADYEKGKKDLESAIKEKEERLENQSSSNKILKARPAMKNM